MNTFRQRETGLIVNDTEFRNMFPEQGFPPVLGLDLLDAMGFDPIMPGPEPVLGYGQVVAEQGIARDANGYWVTSKIAEDMDPAIFATIKEMDQDAVWRNIQAVRDARYYQGVKQVIGGKVFWFHNDLETRSRYSLFDTVIKRKNLPDEYVLHPGWKTMSGEFTPMTVALVYQIVTDGIALEGEIFDSAEMHRAAMLEAANPTAYDFSGGWPESYPDYVKTLGNDSSK